MNGVPTVNDQKSTVLGSGFGNDVKLFRISWARTDSCSQWGGRILGCSKSGTDSFKPARG